MKRDKKIKTGIKVFLGVINLSYAQEINDFLFLLIEQKSKAKQNFLTPSVTSQ